jgi:hypothetical protein
MSLELEYRRRAEKLEVEKNSVESLIQTIHELEKDHADFIAEFVDFDKSQKRRFSQLRSLLHYELKISGENPLEWEARLKDA